MLYNSYETAMLPGVVDVNIAGSGMRVGGLAGQNSRGTVTQCYSSGTVSGQGAAVGGLLGMNEGAVTGCHSAGAVSGWESVGGLVGANGEMGGLITRCYSTAMVNGEGEVGGLVGSAAGTVTECYATGSVSGENHVGGLAGGGLAISVCYATGSVSGRNSVGGLVGSYGNYHELDGGILVDSYSSGSVSGTGTDVGGLVGIIAGNTINCFWDTQTSGQTTSAGGTGKTTAEMEDPNTFMAAGWDFVDQPDGPHDIWAEPHGGGYPILLWQLSPLPKLPAFSGGTGQTDHPYRISTPAELNAIGHNPRLMGAHFELVSDIDLRGIAFYIIGNEFWPFTGSFNGADHTISHLTIRSQVGYAGLFGILASGAQVKNLRVVDANITFSPEPDEEHHYYRFCVGGLVGYNGGAVTHCYSTGTVIGPGSYPGGVGGLVGWNSGAVTQCYNTAVVSGTWWYVGGLVGWNQGTVTQSYSTGMVRGSACVGGLVGSNGGTVTQCYSTGSVSGIGQDSWEIGGLVGNTYQGSVTGCFWDIQTSGQATSAGGTGKTTAQMQTAKTFLDAGWDFVGETKNGTEDIWWINEGKDYPRLWWELGDEASP
ncbi:MAG: hypothetical protein FJ280_27385 [Planctomycetes bacterium]|nr:hypothetical protein [Planctomycetota bacterium]